MESIIEKLKKVYDEIIATYQGVCVIIGIILMVFAFYLESVVWTNILSAISSSLLSIGIVSFGYERWKEKKQELNENKFFIMGPRFLDNAPMLKPIVNIDLKTGKLILIGKINEELIKKEYGFTSLLEDNSLQLLNKSVPLLSYGISFSYLNKKKHPDYCRVIAKAIQKGLGLEISILYPDNIVADLKNIEHTKGESRDTITNFKDLIKDIIKGKKNNNRSSRKTKRKKSTTNSRPIELRLSRYFSPCSFSSLEFLNGRTIRSLEFNFIHEGTDGERITQIHDNYSDKNSHGEFSKFLYNRYKRLYKESFVALRYPMPEDITYHVLGIIESHKAPDEQRKKQFVVDENGNIHNVIVHLNEEDGSFTYVVKNNDGFCQYSDNDFKEEKDRNIPYEFENTIIGNVLMDYKKQANGCIIKPRRSFEINPYVFLLIGKVESNQILPDSYVRDVKEVLPTYLRNININNEIINSILTIIDII